MVFASSLLGAQRKKTDSVENKPASFLVVSLGKALNGMPPSLRGRQVTHPYFTAAHAACLIEVTLGYPPVAVRLVDSGPASYS